MLEPTKLNFDKFVLVHFIIPLLLFVLVLAVLEYFHVDLWVAGHFYNAGLHQWPHKESWLTENVLHVGGRYFTYLLAVAVALCWLISLRADSAFFRYRRHLLFLLISGISGPLIIVLLKNHTHIYCPWSLELFGGDKPYVRLFDYAGGNLEVGHCFPAAHAGAGFTFLNLYFFLLLVKPDYKFYGLCFGLVLGMVYGIAQQMRGAHFLTHDLFALAVCWFSSFVLFMLFFRKQLQWL
ncbi:phosphatase PAP2 family protein [Methylobacter sp. BBA5.1]|uniref:phosphatase PAP2 family protein n=1 Tax=Methylobacter sp. BBA5.1 TaxID=1495064 RepID=UPI0006910C4C|nr:phosphatase PAP2 family protein [Methylobacter sp. BBA5.1]